MGYTTFTGPVRAGNIIDTSGDIPGVNVSNVGQVVMAQRFAYVEDANVVTTICLPAYSQILSMTFYVDVPFTSGAVSIGDTTNVTQYTNAQAFASQSFATLTPTTPAQFTNWFDVGYPDSQIVIDGGTVGGLGAGVLVVQYFQGPNGNT